MIVTVQTRDGEFRFNAYQIALNAIEVAKSEGHPHPATRIVDAIRSLGVVRSFKYGTDNDPKAWVELIDGEKLEIDDEGIIYSTEILE